MITSSYVIDINMDNILIYIWHILICDTHLTTFKNNIRKTGVNQKVLICDLSFFLWFEYDYSGLGTNGVDDDKSFVLIVVIMIVMEDLILNV